MSNEVIRRLRAAGYRVLTRKQWGSTEAATYAYRLRTKPVTLPVPYLFAHITVTDEDGAAGARQVERVGKDRFGVGVSYNWLVDHETHTIFEGQPLAAKGAHTVNDKGVAGFPENLNYFGHAVAWMAMVGDPWCETCALLFAAIQAAERLEDVALESAHYFPHSKFARKDCPTDPVRDALPQIDRLADAMVERKALDFGPFKKESDVSFLDETFEFPDGKERTVRRALQHLLVEQDRLKKLYAAQAEEQPPAKPEGK